MHAESIEATELGSIERAVLASILVDGKEFGRVNAILSPPDFADSRHRLIYSAMAYIQKRSQKIDILTVAATLADRQKLVEAGGKPYLVEMFDGVARSTNATDYAKIVLNEANKRRLWAAAHQLRDVSKSPSQERIQAALHLVRQNADRLGSQAGILEPALAERRMPDRLFSWYHQPDTTSLLFSGEVLVLAGAAGRGKSTLALQIMLAAATAKLRSADEELICGLRVTAGDSVIVSFEDTLAVAEHRLRAIANATGGAAPEAAKRIKFAAAGANEEALFGVPSGGGSWAAAGPADSWTALWSAISLAQPPVRYVVLDPAGSAYSGNPNDVSGVRAFLLALRREARAADIGIILVAHPNKAGAGHRARKEGQRHVTDAVSGSSAWSDAARAVLTLAAEEKEDKRWVLVGDKANYAPPGSIELERVAVRGGGIGAGLFRPVAPTP